jgi:hypothetical protein
VSRKEPKHAVLSDEGHCFHPMMGEETDICCALNTHIAGLQSRYMFLHFVQTLRLEDVNRIIACAMPEFRIAKRPQRPRRHMTLASLVDIGQYTRFWSMLGRVLRQSAMKSGRCHRIASKRPGPSLISWGQRAFPCLRSFQS